MTDIYEFAASTSWVVNHDRGYYPITEVSILFQGEYIKVLPADVVMNSTNQLTITFTSAQEGFVRIQ